MSFDPPFWSKISEEVPLNGLGTFLAEGSVFLFVGPRGFCLALEAKSFVSSCLQQSFWDRCSLQAGALALSQSQAAKHSLVTGL